MADEPTLDGETGPGPEPEHEAPPPPPPGPQEPAAGEKQCRICLDGDDPELGRLIRPCLCKGSVSVSEHVVVRVLDGGLNMLGGQYVHVKCLHRWRITAAARSAFYQCPQCGYHYRFARTKVLGIASNPSQSVVSESRSTAHSSRSRPRRSHRNRLHPPPVLFVLHHDMAHLRPLRRLPLRPIPRGDIP